VVLLWTARSASVTLPTVTTSAQLLGRCPQTRQLHADVLGAVLAGGPQQAIAAELSSCPVRVASSNHCGSVCACTPRLSYNQKEYQYWIARVATKEGRKKGRRWEGIRAHQNSRLSVFAEDQAPSSFSKRACFHEAQLAQPDRNTSSPASRYRCDNARVAATGSALGPWRSTDTATGRPMAGSCAMYGAAIATEGPSTLIT
jgi:hypothetical protein